MSTHGAAAAAPVGIAVPDGLAIRADGVYAEAGVAGAATPALAAAIDAVYRGGNLLQGLDYPAFLKAVFGHDPAPAGGVPAADGAVRIAAAIEAFDPARRALYRPLKIGAGRAEYYFEPVWLADPLDPDAPGTPTRLDPDEFVADLWVKGIRCGIEIDTVRAAIAANKADRIVVARRLEAQPGIDAHIVEVADDLHRNDAPRQLANGRLDLHRFQNRFPQIGPGVRLLRKVAATAGMHGVEMSGAPIPSAPGRDTDLGAYAGSGTIVERGKDGEFLVSQQAGFLSVDGKSSRISVGAKIVSHDGVSAKTTGDLQLSGDYEEFGEVQEKRVIEGAGITVHGDVFGRLVSRGGAVLLHANLVGGAVHNRRGDIRVRGMASGAVLLAPEGAVLLERAENCIVAAARVHIAHAVNCEIIGDEVTVGQAEGSAVAGRRVDVACTAPRRQSEMLVCALQPDGRELDGLIAAVGERIAGFDVLVARHKAALECLGAEPAVRRYLLLASKVRKHEIGLNPEQARQFQKMGQDVAPALTAIGAASNAVKAAAAERQAGAAMLAGLEAQRRDAACIATVTVQQVQGDTQVRVLAFDPRAGHPWLVAPRDAKARLRGPQHGALLFSGAAGSVAWSSGPEETASI